YRRLASRHACASPTEIAAIEIRPSSSEPRHWRRPRPRSPSRFASGTRQPWNTTSCVSVERQPILAYSDPITSTSVSAGTRLVEPSRGGSSVRHATTRNPVIGVPLLVMNAFDPSIVQVPSASFAVVRSALTSEPPLGSVKANPASISPAAIGGSHPPSCSPVPHPRPNPPPRPDPTGRVAATPEPARAEPPHTSGHVIGAGPTPTQ